MKKKVYRFITKSEDSANLLHEYLDGAVEIQKTIDGYVATALMTDSEVSGILDNNDVFGVRSHTQEQDKRLYQIIFSDTSGRRRFMEAYPHVKEETVQNSGYLVGEFSDSEVSRILARGRVFGAQSFVPLRTE